jgi:hypothetical protein
VTDGKEKPATFERALTGRGWAGMLVDILLRFRGDADMVKDEIEALMVVAPQQSAQLTEVQKDSDGRRRCVDCGGWQLEEGHTSLFFPILVAENKFGWICELCTLTRLKRRAAIVTATSSPMYGFKGPVMDHLDRRIDKLSSQRRRSVR